MSPRRRMDISSLLRDPSPRPRSIDALLNAADDDTSRHPPFLGLDALVHVASEERKRLDRVEQATSYDAPRHYALSLHSPHKRSPDSPLTQLSPTIHSSASQTHNYPTLRRHLIEPTPIRSSPTPLPAFPHHPLQPYSHPSSSPHLHSPDGAMSPRYTQGPRMAGGIQVLSTDPLRDTSRHDLSYQAERFMSPVEHTSHDPQKISTLSVLAFSPHDTMPHSQDTRDRPWSRPPQLPHFPFHDTIPVVTSPPLPLPERHPIRVWEDQPIVRETSRPVSSAHIPPVMFDRPCAIQSALGEQLVMDVPRTDLQEHVTENMSSTPSPPRATDSQSPFRTSIQPQSPVHPPQSLHPISSSPLVPASPVLAETQPELQPNIHTLVGHTFSDTVATESLSGKTKVAPDVADVHDIPMTPCQPSPQPVLAEEPDVSTHSTHATVSQNTSRSPSQQPLFTQDEQSALPMDQPPSESREPEHTSEQGMMDIDVDEALLCLVEDRPVLAIPTSSKAQIEPLPTMARQVASASVDHTPRDTVPSPLKGPLVTDEEKDRASMPPPPARNKKAEKDKTSFVTGSRKKKDGTSKPAIKPKPPPKPRAKPPPKPKVKPNVVESSSKAIVPKGAVNANARSRSTSVIPAAADDVIPEPEPDNSEKEDDKLYCVCKTRYDEDRMMIACDRCDEWFHTLCVNMPEPEVDLVDQFICPPCIQKNPHLRTTWKRRCLFGLQHENPASPEACHKPSRGAFSKYCSDECGIKYMRAHITHWEKSGGIRDRLWESVKNATKREGVVVCAKTNRASSPRMMDVDSSDSVFKPLDSAAKRRAEREVVHLNARLEEVVEERELMKHELDMVMWREKVVELASERSAKVEECGWDQRLCFGQEEWTDFGQEVLESYEEARVKVESGDDAMALDSTSAILGEWWCTGKKKCERHAGWQKLRAAEVSFDKETQEGILLKLTTREREIRKCIEDILYPQSTSTLRAPSKPPDSQVHSNGLEKEQVSERGKRRPS